MPADKIRLRGALRAEYAALDESYTASSDSAIARNVLSLPEYKAAGVIYTYYSVGREVDTRAIIAQALSDGKDVVLPVIIQPGIMHPRRLGRSGCTVSGRYGIPVPPDSESFVDLADIDMILVPALAFDYRGFRIGYGGGYYDRLLESCGAYAVGLVRERMLLDAVPTESHDKAVDCIITEKTIARLR